MKTPRKTSTTSSVAKCNAALVGRGGVRIGGYLQPEAATALQTLRDAKYAGSFLAVISTALIDAAKKVSRAQK